MTVYNRDTHAFIRNARWVGRSSQTPGLKKNADGSADIFFGPTPSERRIELDSDRSQRPLRGSRPFLRPAKPLFDKTWKLPDIAKVS